MHLAHRLQSVCCLTFLVTRGLSYIWIAPEFYATLHLPSLLHAHIAELMQALPISSCFIILICVAEVALTFLVT